MRASGGGATSLSNLCCASVPLKKRERSRENSVQNLVCFFLAVSYHPMVDLSRFLAYVLRHAAAQEGLTVRTDGFVAVADLLRCKTLSDRSHTLADVIKAISEGDKKRFLLRKEAVDGQVLLETDEPSKLDVDPAGLWYVRAKHGHSVPVPDLGNTMINHDVDTAVFGTYEADWKSIQTVGLIKKNGKRYIELARGLLQDGVKGLKKDCEVFVYLDTEKAMADGLKFFLSPSKTILCEGDAAGVINPMYFARVLDFEGHVIYRDPTPQESDRCYADRDRQTHE